MKRGEIVLAGFADAVPLACGMIAAVSAVMTAYRIEFSLMPLILFCAFSALLLSFWMNVPKYGFGFGALFLTCVIMLCAFRMTEIGSGAIALAYRVIDNLPAELSARFNTEALLEAAAQVQDPKSGITLVLMLISALNGIILSFSLIRSKTVLLPLLIPLPMLLASLAYTNMQPARWTMVLLCVYFGYTLLGNGLRKSETPGRGALSAILVPALLACGLLILAIFPENRFEPISEETRKGFFSDRVSPIADTVMSWFGEKNPREVDLDETDDRKADDTQLFTVYAGAGTYLLRTHSYGAYRNNRWQAAGVYDGEWNSMKALGTRQKKTDATMWIFEAFSDERAAPYAWTDEPVSDDPSEQSGSPDAAEFRIRAGGWRDYGWRYTMQYRTEPSAVTKEELRYYTDFALKQYVMADGEQKEALLRIAADAGIVKSDDSLETAQAVAAFVRNSGEYTLTPGKTPKGKDFVLYFLTEGHRGYCVHFASATTAILQAMGCPARYTVGYYAEIPENLRYQKVPVTRDDAHAWTEVYVLGVGWVPIESTPGRYSDHSTNTIQRPSEGPGNVSTPKPTRSPTPSPTDAPTAAPVIEPESTPEPTLQPEKPTPSVHAPNDPDGSDGAEQSDIRQTRSQGNAWWLLIPLVPTAWIGTGILVRKRREARFRDSNVRRSIPEMAHYLKRLERFGIPEDPDAEDWALEAAFSDHKMKAEHKTLLKRVRAAQNNVYADKPVRRVILRWILFLI